MAYKIKAVADKAYPGLKKIYIGKGIITRIISSFSIIEIGTYENNKETADFCKFLADVVSRAFGGTIKSVEKLQRV